jgi:hypothetical protein
VLHGDWNNEDAKHYALAIFRRLMDVEGDAVRHIDAAKYDIIYDDTIAAMLSPGTMPSTLEIGLYILTKRSRVRPNFYDAMRVAMANDAVNSALKKDAVDAMYFDVDFGGFAVALQIVHAGLLPEIMKLFPQYPSSCVMTLREIARSDTSADGSALVVPVLATGILTHVRDVIHRTGTEPIGTDLLLETFALRGQSTAVVESGCLDALLSISASIKSVWKLQGMVNACVEVARNGYLDHVRASRDLRDVLARLVRIAMAGARAGTVPATLRLARQVLGDDMVDRIDGAAPALAGGGRSRARAPPRPGTKPRRRSRSKRRSRRSRAKTRRSRTRR